MQNYKLKNSLKTDWDLSKQTVIDYHHQSTLSSLPSPSQFNNAHQSYGVQPNKVPPPTTENLGVNIHHSIKQLNTNKPPQALKYPISDESGKLNHINHMSVHKSVNNNAPIKKDSCFLPKKYDPFFEDKLDDMDISDDENSSQKVAISAKPRLDKSTTIHKSIEVNSGAAFYKGLILFIPPFEQISNTVRGSPAMKMLYASFEFSFKKTIKIDTKAKENTQSLMDVTIYFQDHILSTGSGLGRTPYIEASVRALEILGETCYTIQAKEDYFVKCKLVDAETMKTLNLKRWEAVCQKYPNLEEITKESHFQKTFALFLDSHTSTGIYEDIVCCNLTRQDVNYMKSVVEFFNLTMVPCSLSTNLSKKHTPCVVSIHKYTSAQKLLDILIESGGENDKFKLYAPDTFKDFYKLNQFFWDPAKKNNKSDPKTTLIDEELQAVILKPYENTISELFEKYKSLPKVKKLRENCLLKKVGDAFMKETLQIDMANSKNVAPVERMQLLLKYMEQLQEYGSRVLKSGRPEMIKIYHNAIDNLRKDLDTCRKDIENDQKDKTLSNAVLKLDKKVIGEPSQKRTPPRKRSKSPLRKNKRTRKRSNSPRPYDRSNKSASPKRRPRSKSPRKRPLQKTIRPSPQRKTHFPFRKYTTLPRQDQSSHSSQYIEENVLTSIFADQIKKYMENLRRFRIEIENTPLEIRSTLKDKYVNFKEQLFKFHKEVSANPRELGSYVDEIEICKDELQEQIDLLEEKQPFSDTHLGHRFPY